MIQIKIPSFSAKTVSPSVNLPASLAASEEQWNENGF